MRRTRYRLTLLGWELGHLDIEHPAEPGNPQTPSEETVVHRHSGDFGFGPLPGPTWRSVPSDIEAAE